MKLILIRHGQTTYNAKEIHQPFDSPLSELGIQQAKSLQPILNTIQFDVVFISAMPRTRHTATLALPFYTKSFIKDERLNETENGEFAGLVYGSRQKAAEKIGMTEFDFKPKNGTSLQEVYENVVNWYEEVKQNYSHKTIVAFVHGGVIRSLLKYLLHKDTIRANNCSFTVIENDSVLQINSQKL